MDSNGHSYESPKLDLLFGSAHGVWEKMQGLVRIRAAVELRGIPSAAYLKVQGTQQVGYKLGYKQTNPN